MSATVEAGRYLLEVGGRPGTLISSPAQPQDGDARALRRALKKGGADRPRNKSAVDPLANAVDEASESTAGAERAVALFTALVEGNVLDPKLLSSEIDVLVDLVERLDRRGRWKEALRLARALSGLLALTMRWAELVRSLKIALEAAEKLGDSHALGWAKHELGTLHLAAEDTAAAERRLGEAREIRRRLDDRRGLAATNRNLEVLCQNLRRLLRDGRLVRRRTLLRPALGIVVALLVAAGVASAVVTSGDATEPPGPPAAAACDNGRDDDGDGFIDFADDPDCDSPGDSDETDPRPARRRPPPATTKETMTATGWSTSPTTPTATRPTTPTRPARRRTRPPLRQQETMTATGSSTSPTTPTATRPTTPTRPTRSWSSPTTPVLTTPPMSSPPATTATRTTSNDAPEPPMRRRPNHVD